MRNRNSKKGGFDLVREIQLEYDDIICQIAKLICYLEKRDNKSYADICHDIADKVAVIRGEE